MAHTTVLPCSEIQNLNCLKTLDNTASWPLESIKFAMSVCMCVCVCAISVSQWQMVETHLCFNQAITMSIVVIGYTNKENVFVFFNAHQSVKQLIN